MPAKSALGKFDFGYMGPILTKQSVEVQAVVDSKGRMLGVRGLWACDASVFSFGVPAHPQAGLNALAEKIAAELYLKADVVIYYPGYKISRCSPTHNMDILRHLWNQQDKAAQPG